MTYKSIFPNYNKRSKIVSKKTSLDKYAQLCLMTLWAHKRTIKKAVKKIDPNAIITYRYTFNKLMNIKRVKLKDCWGQADQTGIDIAYTNMRESFLIGIILHKCLHNIAN